MGSRTSPSLLILTGLLFGVTVYQLEVTGQPPPELDSNPPVGDLAEGRPWTLKCIFNRSALGFAIVVGTVETPVEGLKVRVAELDADAVPRLLATENLLEYTVRTVPTRRLNNLPISCRQNYFLNSTAVHTVITKTLLVKYGPLRNISESITECVNITSINGDQPVHLNASGIFEDPGNPTSTVDWTWRNHSITDGRSGMFNGILSQRVTGADHNHVIVAQYSNAFGSTMQRFILCVNSVPGVPANVICSRIVNGYNCLWSPPADIGGYKITHYKVGHNEGVDKLQNLPVLLPSSVTSHMINTLEAGTMYTFAVSAVNVLGSGPSGSANVITPSRPGVAVNIVVLSQSRFSIQATWDPPLNKDVDFPVTDYQIFLYDTMSTPALRNGTTGGEMIKTFDGLKDNTTYWIRVSARNAVGFGSLSDFVKGATLPNGTVGVVSNVLSTEVIDTSFSVQWVAADAGGSNFEITRYKVDVLKDGTLVKSVEVLGDQTWAKIDGLKANTTYEVKVFADNGKGYGNPSVVLTVRTEEAKKDESGDHNLGFIIGIVIGVIGVIVIVVVIVYYRHKKIQGEIKEDASSKGTKAKSTLDQMTQSSAYELSGQANYAEVRPAEKRETLVSNPAYSTASNR